MNILINNNVSDNASAEIIITSNFDQLSDKISADNISYLKENLKENEIEEIKNFKDHLFIINPASSAEKTRIQGYNVAKSLDKVKAKNVNISFETEADAINFTEGLALSSYKYQKYKTEKSNTLASIHFTSPISNSVLEHLNAKIEGTFITRDLVNEHPGHQTPIQLSDDIQNLSTQYGFKFEKLEMAQIQSLKMGGLLAVNQASHDEPTFNILEWKGNNPKNKKPIVLVGKGVVYDTGGLSLKPTPHSMDFMKADMAGAGAVIGAICAIAKAKLDIHVIGLIAATDNRIGADAYSPGDVITMYNGKTVEVLNTDAEGRLTMADALSYGDKYEPELIIDIATLTGAAARAIGTEGIVFMGNADESYKTALKEAGNNVHERLVEFPLWDEYKVQLKSDIADITNLGGDTGGAITAGCFLENFTKSPWIHIDIAGPSYLHQEDKYRGKNGSGVGVRLFFDWLANY